MYWHNLYEDRLKAISWPDIFVRNVNVMTNGIWLQGIEHGWTGSVRRAEDREPRTRRFVLSDWLPAAILARGGRIDRETARAYSDLRGVQDARESGR